MKTSPFFYDLNHFQNDSFFTSLGSGTNGGLILVEIRALNAIETESLRTIGVVLYQDNMRTFLKNNFGNFEFIFMALEIHILISTKIVDFETNIFEFS